MGKRQEQTFHWRGHADGIIAHKMMFRTSHLKRQMRTAMSYDYLPIRMTREKKEDKC